MEEEHQNLEICAITQFPIETVAEIVSCGHKFEYAAIQDCIEVHGNITCPLCCADLLDLTTHEVVINKGIPPVRFALRPNFSANQDSLDSVLNNTLSTASKKMLELIVSNKCLSVEDQALISDYTKKLLAFKRTVGALSEVKDKYNSLVNFHKNKMSA